MLTSSHFAIEAATACAADEARIPQMVGLKVQDAHDLWGDRGFTGTVSPAETNANKNNLIASHQIK